MGMGRRAADALPVLHAGLGQGCIRTRADSGSRLVCTPAVRCARALVGGAAVPGGGTEEGGRRARTHARAHTGAAAAALTSGGVIGSCRKPGDPNGFNFITAAIASPPARTWVARWGCLSWHGTASEWRTTPAKGQVCALAPAHMPVMAPSGVLRRRECSSRDHRAGASISSMGCRAELWEVAPPTLASSSNQATRKHTFAHNP